VHHSHWRPVDDHPPAGGPLRAAPAGSAHDWDWRAKWLPDGPPPASVIAPDQLRLGHVTCVVTEASHRSVSRAQLAAGPPTDSADLTFHSPTYFAQNGTDVLIPDPRLIAGSWRRRWNASHSRRGMRWRLTKIDGAMRTGLFVWQHLIFKQSGEILGAGTTGPGLLVQRR
jgi:hypothetical protein